MPQDTLTDQSLRLPTPRVTLDSRLCQVNKNNQAKPALEDSTGISRAGWLGRLAILMISGFGWESVPHRIRMKNDDDSLHQPQASACLHSHTCRHKYTQQKHAPHIGSEILLCAWRTYIWAVLGLLSMHYMSSWKQEDGCSDESPPTSLSEKLQTA